VLIQIYEQDNLFRAEAGKLLQQASGFDLPSLKKQLTSLNKVLNENSTK